VKWKFLISYKLQRRKFLIFAYYKSFYTDSITMTSLFKSKFLYSERSETSWRFTMLFLADAWPCESPIFPAEEKGGQATVLVVTKYLGPSVFVCCLHKYWISTVYGQQVLAGQSMSVHIFKETVLYRWFGHTFHHNEDLQVHMFQIHFLQFCVSLALMSFTAYANLLL
jgi:hypothetical protein